MNGVIGLASARYDRETGVVGNSLDKLESKIDKASEKLECKKEKMVHKMDQKLDNNFETVNSQLANLQAAQQRTDGMLWIGIRVLFGPLILICSKFAYDWYGVLMKGK
ncbi:hypothetical protein HOY80DRAFT_1141390 [Tuber brumale]|nr:hypothetical protein HOY80DRAFT_1141390 [Tuber brumale]